MKNTDQETTLYHFKENVWLRRFSTNKKNYMDIVNICLCLEDKTFVNLAVLHYYNGVYYLKDESLGTIDDISFLSYIEKITGIKKSKEKTDINKSISIKADVPFEKVCEDYKNTNSIKKTAKNMGVSEEKTKKILITAGLYTGGKYKEIKELLEKGKTVDEIAEQLKMSPKQVRIFLPYTDKP